MPFRTIDDQRLPLPGPGLNPAPLAQEIRECILNGTAPAAPIRALVRFLQQLTYRLPVASFDRLQLVMGLQVTPYRRTEGLRVASTQNAEAKQIPELSLSPCLVHTFMNIAQPSLPPGTLPTSAWHVILVGFHRHTYRACRRLDGVQRSSPLAGAGRSSRFAPKPARRDSSCHCPLLRCGAAAARPTSVVLTGGATWTRGVSPTQSLAGLQHAPSPRCGKICFLTEPARTASEAPSRHFVVRSPSQDVPPHGHAGVRPLLPHPVESAPGPARSLLCQSLFESLTRARRDSFLHDLYAGTAPMHLEIDNTKTSPSAYFAYSSGAQWRGLLSSSLPASPCLQ